MSATGAVDGPELPKHPLEHYSYYDEEEEAELVFIACPACKRQEETCWEFLESGTRHRCEHCTFEWVVA